MSGDGAAPLAAPEGDVAKPTPAELVPAQAAFDRGDFRAVRRLVDELLAAGPQPPVAAAARELRERTGTDPLAIWVGAACLLFFLVVVWLTASHR